MSFSAGPKTSLAKPTVKSKYEKSNKKKSFVNSLSAIPMFDLKKNSGEAFYQTSYRQQYPEAVREADAAELGPHRLHSRSCDFGQPSDRQGLSYADRYRLKKLNSESLTADSGFFAEHYKRPVIPEHIKQRDGCYQSNAEKNVSFLHTVYGIVPYVPSKVNPSPQQQQYRKVFNKADDFYKSMQSEHQANFKQINKGQVQRSEIPEYIRRDNPYQTNAEKSIRHIRTTGGNQNVVSFVPTKDKYQLMMEKKLRESYEQIKEKEPTMGKYKLVNEINATPMVFGYLSAYEPQMRLGNPRSQNYRNHSEISFAHC